MSPGPVIVIKDEPDDEDDVRFVRVESLKISNYAFLVFIVSTKAKVLIWHGQHFFLLFLNLTH